MEGAPQAATPSAIRKGSDHTRNRPSIGDRESIVGILTDGPGQVLGMDPEFLPISDRGFGSERNLSLKQKKREKTTW